MRSIGHPSCCWRWVLGTVAMVAVSVVAARTLIGRCAWPDLCLGWAVALANAVAASFMNRKAVTIDLMDTYGL